jgi:hypothetical protein
MPTKMKAQMGPLKDKEAMKKFKGKDSAKEEMAEAKALKNGEITMRQYKKGEMKEGEKKPDMKRAAAIKAGKVSPKQYAEQESKEMKKMANGGKAMHKMPNGKMMPGAKHKGK